MNVGTGVPSSQSIRGTQPRIFVFAGFRFLPPTARKPVSGGGDVYFSGMTSKNFVFPGFWPNFENPH